MRGTYTKGPYYLCRTFHSKGRSQCYSNAIREEILVDCVVRKIQQHYLSETAIKRFRKILAKEQTAARVDPQEERDLRRQLAKLDQQIDTGAERVFTAPEAIVRQVYAKLEELRQERDEIQRRLDALASRQPIPQQDQEREIDAALDALRNLRETFNQADPAEVRQLLSSLVTRIELHYSHGTAGKRTRNTFEHGTIFVRPPMASSLMYSISGD